MSEAKREDPPWIRIGALLSLDLTMPHLREMGLHLAAEPLRDAMREALVAISERAEDKANWPIDVAAGYRSAVYTRLGETAADTVLRWGEHVVIPRHAIHPQWSGWMTAISHAHKNRYNHIILPAAHRNALYRGFLGATDIADLESVFAARREGPFSDWDVLTMAQHGFDPGYRPVDPFRWIGDATKVHRFQLFVRDFDNSLNDGMRTRLRVSATSYLQEVGVWMPEPLQDWHELAAGPAC